MNSTVKIFFYTETPSTFGREITCVLALAMDNGYKFQSVYNQSTLKQMLCNEQAGPTIIILAAMNDRELDELLEIKKEFTHIPLVLILADDTEATLKKAHRFHPRFLTTVHHDFTYALSVVEHLCKTINQSYQRYPVEI